MTGKEQTQLVAQLHDSLTKAAAALQKLDAEVTGRRDRHDHRAAEELEQLVAPWRSALLSQGSNASRLERWRSIAAVAGHRLA
jgi:hypothetical protein